MMELAILMKLCMDGRMCMCNLLCMNGWNYICMHDETYVLDISYIFAVKIVGLKKTEKKAMHDLCRPPLMAKDP